MQTQEERVLRAMERVVSLDKGSVLAYTDGRYYVTGYAEDGSDVRFP